VTASTLPSTPTQPTGALADTGADIRPLLAGAAGLVLLGLLLRVAGRRRAGT
jgi:LPXTG-motif cell wall-anchored protein